IAEQGRPGELYQIGQKLSSGVELVEVHADRVVLNRGGAHETLRFPEQTTMLATSSIESDAPVAPSTDQAPEEQDSESSAPEPPPGPTDSAGVDSQSSIQRNEPITSRIEQYRSKLDTDPAGTLNSLGVSAVSADGAKGYQVGSLASSPALAQTGLQSGDV